MSTEQFVSSTLLLLGAECGYQSGLMSAAVDNEALPLCCFFFLLTRVSSSSSVAQLMMR